MIMRNLCALAWIASFVAVLAPCGSAGANNKFRIHDHHHHDDWKISCNTARHMLQERGYKVRIKSCISTVYSFYAVRNGHTYVFRVDSRTGFISPE